MIVETEWKGLHVEANVIIDDTEGDASVPGGVRTMPPYAEDIYVGVRCGGQDIYPSLDGFAQDDIENLLLEKAQS